MIGKMKITSERRFNKRGANDVRNRDDDSR